MTDPLRHIRISFGDDDVEDVLIPIVAHDDPKFSSTGVDEPVTLPNGETIAVYAEVGQNEAMADVSLSVIEGDRVTAVSCGRGVVMSYITVGGSEVLLQVGTGPWEG